MTREEIEELGKVFLHPYIEDLDKPKLTAFLAGYDAANEWVKVEDGCEMPEPATPVICYWPFNPFDSDEDITVEDLTDFNGDILPRTTSVTHWKHLPPVPVK